MHIGACPAFSAGLVAPSAEAAVHVGDRGPGKTSVCRQHELPTNLGCIGGAQTRMVCSKHSCSVMTEDNPATAPKLSRQAAASLS